MKKIRFVHQLGNTDCSLACLAMLFRYYNTKVSLSLLAAENMTGRDGLSLTELKQIVEKYHFEFKAYKTGYNEKNIVDNLPVMICSKQNHFVLIEKKVGNNYKIVDPDKGRGSISQEILEREYLDLIVAINPQYTGKQEYKEPKIKISIPRKNVLLNIFLTLVLEMLMLGVPQITGRIIDDINSNCDYKIMMYAICATCVAYTYFTLSLFRKWIILYMQLNFYKKIINELISKIFSIDLAFFQSHMTGDIVNRFNTVNSVNDFVSNIVITFLIDFVTAIVCGIAMASMNPILFLIIILIAVIQAFLINIIRKKITLDTQLYLGEQSKIQGDLVDLVSNLVQIKCMGIDLHIKKSLVSSYADNTQTLLRKEKWSDLLECVISTISLVTSLIIYIIGGFFVARKTSTIGELVQFVSLSAFFISPIKSLSIYLPQFSTVKGMIDRIKEMLFYKELKSKGEVEVEQFKSLELKNVYFGYTNKDKLLKNINISVKTGDKIAIVGPSGSGKTSITKLMMNIFNTYEGKVLINDIEIDEINRESFYKKLAVVTQLPVAFNDTIRKNIDPAEILQDKDVYDALKQAELFDEVMCFPLKLNTKIGENGQNISGGQKQRIAIARALATKPSIIIFDEGTSNLDAVTEKKIFCNLNSRGITQVIISHRLSAIKDADCIYVIKDGQITEAGKHADLIEKKGVYYQNYSNYS